jgi:hypothetical protein
MVLPLLSASNSITLLLLASGTERATFVCSADSIRDADRGEYVKES